MTCKTAASRQLAQTKDAMKRLELGALHRIQKLPAMVNSFFRMPPVNMPLSDIVYAKLIID